MFEKKSASGCAAALVDAYICIYIDMDVHGCVSVSSNEKKEKESRISEVPM